MSIENEYVSREVDEIRNNALLEEGANHYKAKRYKEAFEAYEKATQLSPNDSAAYVSKGNCLRKLKDYWAALSIYDRAIELDPNNVSAHNGKCYTYVSLGDHDTALFVHEKVIKLDPKNATAYNCIGMVFKLQGRYLRRPLD